MSGITATENRIDPDSAYITLPTGLFSSKWSYLTSVPSNTTQMIFSINTDDGYLVELKFGRTTKSCGNTRLSARVPTVFLVFPNFRSCFYNYHDEKHRTCYFLKVVL